MILFNKWVKIKDVCEQLLLSYDKEVDCDVIARNSDNWNFLILRVKLIVQLFNMTDFFDFDVWVDENATAGSLEKIFATILNNCDSWECSVLEPGMYGVYGENSLEFVTDELVKELSSDKSFSEMEMTNLRKIVERKALSDVAYGDDEYFSLWMLENSKISGLVKSGNVKSECLEPLYYPLMLNPSAETFLSEDYSMCCFIMGTSSFYSEVELSMIYMSYMLFIVIVYVEAAYRIENNIDNKDLILHDVVYY